MKPDLRNNQRPSPSTTPTASAPGPPPTRGPRPEAPVTTPVTHAPALQLPRPEVRPPSDLNQGPRFGRKPAKGADIADARALTDRSSALGNNLNSRRRPPTSVRNTFFQMMVVDSLLSEKKLSRDETRSVKNESLLPINLYRCSEIICT